MQNTGIKFTYEDYRHTDEGKRYELIDGDLILMSPSPKVAHQRLIWSVGTPVRAFVIEQEIGEVFVSPIDVVLSDTDVVQPDLVYVSREHSNAVTEDNIRGAPDLVIEILSPSTAGRDRTVKRRLYARYGISEYWLIDPEAKSISVLFLGDEGYGLVGIFGEGQQLTSPTLHGFTLDLDHVF